MATGKNRGSTWMQGWCKPSVRAELSINQSASQRLGGSCCVGLFLWRTTWQWRCSAVQLGFAALHLPFNWPALIPQGHRKSWSLSDSNTAQVTMVAHTGGARTPVCYFMSSISPNGGLDLNLESFLHDCALHGALVPNAGVRFYIYLKKISQISPRYKLCSFSRICCLLFKPVPVNAGWEMYFCPHTEKK